jgi:hypothetical protein
MSIEWWEKREGGGFKGGRQAQNAYATAGSLLLYRAEYEVVYIAPEVVTIRPPT